MARELASRTSNTVGLLLRDAANPAYGLLFTELQHAAHAVGMSVVSMTISVDQDGQQQVASLYRLLGMRVAGLIVAKADRGFSIPAETSVEQTIGRADRALYRAKAEGRDRTLTA